ncbi:MAG: hypothetical protein HOH26_15430 [Alphaproteobacteria bacterium]|nr:hypothetical protein [Alphaproteobacteria bacterium]
MSQEDIKLEGHAIEVRLYAEDTSQDFLPCTGTVDLWQPSSGDGLRFDSGIETGQDISPFYDPMIAKVVAWGETREVARHRLIEGLKDTVLFGLTTNRGFLIDVLGRETFAKGEATTAFIGDEFTDDDLAATTPDLMQSAMASVLQYHEERESAFVKCVNVSPTLVNWSSGQGLVTRYVFAWGEIEFDLTVTPQDRHCYLVQSGETSLTIDLLEAGDNTARLRINGRRQLVHYHIPTPGHIWLSVEGKTTSFRNHIAFAGAPEEVAGSGRILAPMHGTLLEVCVKSGDTVKSGDRLAVLEAMKMQHEILSEVNGTVMEVHAIPGSQTAADTLLIEIEEAE